MRAKLDWIGTVAFQVVDLDSGRQLVFDLPENLRLPPEFKEGDEITIVNHPDHPASIAMDMNGGYYEVTHVASGQLLTVPHSTSKWRFE